MGKVWEAGKQMIVVILASARARNESSYERASTYKQRGISRE
jgi:hypothetical protein